MSQIKGKKPLPVSKYWIDRTRLTTGGLISVGLIITQDFISSGIVASSKVLDIPALISVVAFAVALPLLSAQFPVTFEDGSRHYVWDDTWGLQVAYWLGMIAAIVGIVAAFWHISLIAGLVILVGTLVSTALYADYGAKLHRLDKAYRAKGFENRREDEHPHVIEHK